MFAANAGRMLLAGHSARCLPGTRRCRVHRKINEKERRSTHSFHLKCTAHSEKCTGPTCKMLFYPLFSLSVGIIPFAVHAVCLTAKHSEAFCATGGTVNEETATPKEHQSCRKYLNISEGKNRDGQSKQECK